MTPKLCPHHRAKFDSKKSVTFIKLPPGNWVVQLLIWIGNMWQLKAETIKTQVWSRIRWCLILPQPGSLVWFSLVWNIAYRLKTAEKRNQRLKREKESQTSVCNTVWNLYIASATFKTCKCIIISEAKNLVTVNTSQQSVVTFISNSLLTSPPYLSHELFSSRGHESE